LAHLDQLLSDPKLAASFGILKVMKDELTRARDAASATSSAINVARDHFSKQIDDQLADYQALVLEYAQFVTDEELERVVPASQRDTLRSRFASGDVLISDDALGGKGLKLRSLFGIPEGTP
jgi:hypothetical protein